MNLSYPVTLKYYQDGQVGVFFADVPGAITAGTNEVEALDRAQDALTVALSSYLDDGRTLPDPSKAKRGQPVVVLPPRIALKHIKRLDEIRPPS
ncbi:MAG: type II toxin-antitoxin system HicB family antitoxin [Propionivibrio sp.]|uniref:type II toxin-antitoxin system HicB family antitoxin n=1 Tax=Propionivibrio sp. TaxID=2212460 RepID=UPI001A5D5B7D|nr:type II toxin-antitoxin system HicB family antitoxin [Propionivibrio sp.]MBL8414211.1 type II toxin-antitoxin system HicB family antitoxin [Propionivibrio sp.]